MTDWERAGISDVDALTVELDEQAPGWDVYRGMDKRWHAKAPSPDGEMTVASATLSGALVELRKAVEDYVPPVPDRPRALSMRILRRDGAYYGWHIHDDYGFVIRFKTKREAQACIDRMTDARWQEIIDWDRQYGAAEGAQR